MNSTQFRAELLKIMPGYSWTVHRTDSDSRLVATGAQSSGFNRLSTLHVTRKEREKGEVRYEAKSAGNGLKSPWEHTAEGRTLAQALRQLQQHYDALAASNRALANALQRGRNAADKNEEGE